MHAPTLWLCLWFETSRCLRTNTHGLPFMLFTHVANSNTSGAKVASRALMHQLTLIACLCSVIALTPPELLVHKNAVLLTAPPKAVDPDGVLATRLMKLTNASAFVVDPTQYEPAPLALPTVELFVADATTRIEERDPRRAALEAAAGNAWARSNARAHRVARENDDILVRATAPESSEPSLDWALGRARRLLTARRRGFVDVLCAIEDDDGVFEDMVEIFTSGVRGEAARRADATEPLARLVRVNSAVVPEDLARREASYEDVLYRRATRGDDRAVFDRCLDECDACVYWLDSDAVQLPRGAAFIAAGSSVDAAAAGCRATVVDWESAAAFCDAENGGASYLNTCV